MKVVVIMPTRLNSQRLPQKPLQKLKRDGTRLIDAALAKLSRLRMLGHDVLTSFPYTDYELIELGLNHGINNIGQGGTGHWWQMTDTWVDLPYDRIVCLNLVCMPFIQLHTIRQIIEYAHDSNIEPGRTHVYEEKTIAWDEYGTLLVQTNEPLDTKTAPSILLPSHIGDIFCPSDCGQRDGCMTRPKPMVTSGLDPIELIDIDTLSDLHIAQQISNGVKL